MNKTFPTAIQLDRLLSCFKRWENPSATSKRIAIAMEPLFHILSQLAPSIKNAEYKSIWIKVPRGEIAEYSSFEDMKDWGEVNTYNEYIERWNMDYPDDYCWYEVELFESFEKNGQLRYRGVLVGDKTIVSAMMNEEFSGIASWHEDVVVELLSLITISAKNSMDKIRNESYNVEVCTELPFKFRTGVIRRSVLWSVDKEYMKFDSDGLSDDKISEFRNLINSGANDECSIRRLNSMTANDFFKACCIGYDACGFKDEDMEPVARYLKHADGRDEGLTGTGHGLNEGPGIDFNSPEEWNKWFFDRNRGGGHPWEVIRGGNSTHVDFYVCHDKETLEWKVRAGLMTEEQAILHPCGFYYSIAGKHRPFETVNFYVALNNAGFPVYLYDAEEILSRFDGSDYVGIVPHSVIPRYCEEMFPKKYGHVIDFMHVYEDEYEQFGDKIEWLELEEAKLKP